MTDALVAANLNERVYDELRTRVLTRREPAGAKLSLHVLAAELGVSRSPVHHALTRLVSEGLLTVQPRRGYYIAPVTARALAEGYDVRLALELLAAERAYGQVSLDSSSASTTSGGDGRRDLARPVGCRERRFPRAPDRPRRQRSALAVLPELSVNLMMQVIRGGHVEGHANLVTEHRRIVEAFAESDLEAAERAIREHIDTGRRIALDMIERAGGVL